MKDRAELSYLRQNDPRKSKREVHIVEIRAGNEKSYQSCEERRRRNQRGAGIEEGNDQIS